MHVEQTFYEYFKEYFLETQCLKTGKKWKCPCGVAGIDGMPDVGIKLSVN